MNTPVTIALDAMGGDYGPPVVVSAALRMLAERQDIRLILVGDQELLTHELRVSKPNERLHIQHASQQVASDELPSQALRLKKDSSMRVAINLVKEGRAHACVSAGNTGALMATARYVLKTLPGVDRPAICAALPTKIGRTHMLDLGANVDCSPEQLFQFAVMGSVLVNAADNIAKPRVGLLNIGEEEIKGNERVKDAARLLSNSDMNYIGFVEGNDIYGGEVDVVVCDGFTGNVALKSSEGVAQMIGYFIKQEFKRNLLTRLAAIIALPALQAVQRKIDPRNYNGASFLGLQGIVIKSHGCADVISFSNAIKEALLEVDKNVPQHIGKQLESQLAERDAL